MREIAVPRDKLKVIVRSKQARHFDGYAKSVTATNDVGEFDILPAHANFVSLIKKRVTIDKGLESEKAFELKKGVLAVKTNIVNVYLDL